MLPCAFCDRPLICDGCQAPFAPPSLEHYEALSRPEDVILCPACGQVLICHWCQMPYDGGGDGADAPGTAGT